MIIYACVSGFDFVSDIQQLATSLRLLIERRSDGANGISPIFTPLTPAGICLTETWHMLQIELRTIIYSSAPHFSNELQRLISAMEFAPKAPYKFALTVHLCQHGES